MADSFVHDGSAADQVWYTLDDRGACAVVIVGGRVHSDNCSGVCDAVEVAGRVSSGLVVDMTRLEFAHAEAAGPVVLALQQAHQTGSSVAVVAPPEPVGWLLRFNAPSADIPICSSLEEATALLSRTPRTPGPPTSGTRPNPSAGAH